MTGPNGPVTDLGNRNMVLWNHGGGYVGLLQDETSAGSDLMSIGELPVGTIDVLDFDVCLMGGYETLVKISGLANYAVFSEEVVPGAGNPLRRRRRVFRGVPHQPFRGSRHLQVLREPLEGSAGLQAYVRPGLPERPEVWLVALGFCVACGGQPGGSAGRDSAGGRPDTGTVAVADSQPGNPPPGNMPSDSSRPILPPSEREGHG